MYVTFLMGGFLVCQPLGFNCPRPADLEKQKGSFTRLIGSLALQ